MKIKLHKYIRENKIIVNVIIKHNKLIFLFLKIFVSNKLKKLWNVDCNIYIKCDKAMS